MLALSALQFQNAGAPKRSWRPHTCEMFLSCIYSPYLWNIPGQSWTWIYTCCAPVRALWTVPVLWLTGQIVGPVNVNEHVPLNFTCQRAHACEPEYIPVVLRCVRCGLYLCYGWLAKQSDLWTEPVNVIERVPVNFTWQQAHACELNYIPVVWVPQWAACEIWQS